MFGSTLKLCKNDIVGNVTVSIQPIELTKIEVPRRMDIYTDLIQRPDSEWSNSRKYIIAIFHFEFCSHTCTLNCHSKICKEFNNKQI